MSAFLFGRNCIQNTQSDGRARKRRLACSAAILPLALLAAVATTGPALADPLYSLVGTIPVTPTSLNPSGLFKVNDISYLDPATHLDYLADRSNNAIDVFSTVTNTQVGQIGIGDFQGVRSSSDISGPNGVQGVDVGGTPTIFTGDGNSSVPVFALSNNGTAGALTARISTDLPASSPAIDKRADEMAYDPVDHILAVANDAAAPAPYLSFIDTKNDTVLHQTVFNGANGTPNATGGLEQTVYDPNTHHFYTSVPQIGPNASDPGGIAVIDPTTGAVTKVFDFASFGIGSCNPAGLVQGVGNQLLVGCSTKNSSSLIFDPTANGGAGKVVAQVSQVSGSDQVAFDPANKLFFLAARDNATGPVLGIIDGATDTWLENVPTAPGAHAVQVDPGNGEVLVPLNASAGNTVCAAGCIGVYQVPEPSSLALLFSGVIGLLGLVGADRLWQRRRRTA